MSDEKITIKYSEPEEYFPKEIREKYFGKVETKKEKRNKKENKDRFTHIYVRTNDLESREKLVDYLEKGGFSVDEEFGDTKQSILESRYPIKVNVQRKAYGVIHNTTCAAAAISSWVVISEEEFYERYMGKG